MIVVLLFGCMIIMFLGYVGAATYVGLHTERRVFPVF